MEPEPQLSPQEREEWQRIIAAADRNNILHHCRTCDRQWVGSFQDHCECGSRNLERIACWQFPDD